MKSYLTVLTLTVCFLSAAVYAQAEESKGLPKLDKAIFIDIPTQDLE